MHKRLTEPLLKGLELWGVPLSAREDAVLSSRTTHGARVVVPGDDLVPDGHEGICTDVREASVGHRMEQALDVERGGDLAVRRDGTPPCLEETHRLLERAVRAATLLRSRFVVAARPVAAFAPLAKRVDRDRVALGARDVDRGNDVDRDARVQLDALVFPLPLPGIPAVRLKFALDAREDLVPRDGRTARRDPTERAAHDAEGDCDEINIVHVPERRFVLVAALEERRVPVAQRGSNVLMEGHGSRDGALRGRAGVSKDEVVRQVGHEGQFLANSERDERDESDGGPVVTT